LLTGGNIGTVEFVGFVGGGDAGVLTDGPGMVGGWCTLLRRGRGRRVSLLLLLLQVEVIVRIVMVDILRQILAFG
jgi:hypothetical protein